jgi:hypothetical protein
VNECTANTDNCAAVATCTNTAGSYTCACPAGYTGNGQTCTPVVVSCNLTGTFAQLMEIDIEWDPVTAFGITVISGGTATTESWSIVRQEQNGNTVEAEQIACGGTSPDFCSPFLSQALSQFVPDAVWDRPTMPSDVFTVQLNGPADPGDPFVGSSVASILGVSLANPTGAWPATYNAAGITWVDHDNDGRPGVTSIMAGPGTSPVCNLPYGNLPIPSSGAYAVGVFTGSRTTSNLEGAIVDCDTISGDVVGPDNGWPRLEARVGGCVKDNGQLCTAAEIASLDDGASTASQRILGARFTMVRVADNITCAGARAVDFE